MEHSRSDFDVLPDRQQTVLKIKLDGYIEAAVQAARARSIGAHEALSLTMVAVFREMAAHSLSRESAHEILALSAPIGARWQSIPRTQNGEYWVSSDKKTLAYFATEGNVLLVRDPNFYAKD